MQGGRIKTINPYLGTTMGDLSQETRLKQCEARLESQELTILKLKQQVDSLNRNVHRLSEILNCVINRQVIKSEFKDNELTVTIVAETEPLTAIDGANLQ